MVNKIHIKNFKSVYDLEIELGRFNVFIGENGCGKTNILEAIAFGGAASNNLLFDEFLWTRGVRFVEPDLIFSAFPEKKKTKTCEIQFEIKNVVVPYTLEFSEKEGWKNLYKDIILKKALSSFAEEITKEHKQGNSLTPDTLSKVSDTILENIIQNFGLKIGIEGYIDLNQSMKQTLISEFLLYTPEYSFLRSFIEEGQIFPLGIKGEGLFNEFKKIAQSKSKKEYAKIIKYLAILDWFKSLSVPANGFPGEKYISIQDKYLDKAIKNFDQRSANEGFLFLLFYLTLFISKDTPDFFAIDNLEASFNPKLCTQLTQTLVKLSKEHKKQAIVTTHNPFILDGLDLSDDNQRLFVVRRNLDGHTITTRVKPDKPLSYKLSEAWMNGYIGGLPNNF